jgi:hypothetical protein
MLKIALINASDNAVEINALYQDVARSGVSDITRKVALATAKRRLRELSKHAEGGAQ